MAGQIALRFPGDGCIPQNVRDAGGLLGRGLIALGGKFQSHQDGGKWANAPEDNGGKHFCRTVFIF